MLAPNSWRATQRCRPTRRPAPSPCSSCQSSAPPCPEREQKFSENFLRKLTQSRRTLNVVKTKLKGKQNLVITLACHDTRLAEKKRRITCSSPNRAAKARLSRARPQGLATIAAKHKAQASSFPSEKAFLDEQEKLLRYPLVFTSFPSKSKPTSIWELTNGCNFESSLHILIHQEEYRE